MLCYRQQIIVAVTRWCFQRLTDAIDGADRALVPVGQSYPLEQQ